jgi:glycosyltransferase involved in cell wall biosynthesis
LFTVIITTHDRPLLLGRALRSLIDQTFQDFFVIIIADESLYLPPYEELKRLDGRYVYVLRSGVAGPAESRNMGLDLVRTDYVLFLDDDDAFEPDHLAALAREIKRCRPKIAYCDFKVVDEDRNTFPPKRLRVAPAAIGSVKTSNILVKNIIPNSCLVFLRKVIGSIRFDPSYIIYEDWDFLLNVAKNVDLVYLKMDSVLIHKSWAEGAANQRRGAKNNDKVIDQTLVIYKRHPAAQDVRLARQKFFADAGLNLPLTSF